MKLNFRLAFFMLLAVLMCGGISTRLARAQVKENGGTIELNHRWPKYVSGVWDVDKTLFPEQSCSQIQWVTSTWQGDHEGVRNHLSERPNFIWGYSDSVIIYDLDDPDTAEVETSSTIDVFPTTNENDHVRAAKPAQSFTVYATNDKGTPITGWELATKEEVWGEGWDENSICEDYVTRWDLGGEFRYVGVKKGGPGVLDPNWGAWAISIDTVGIPPLAETPVIANFKADPTAGLVPLDVNFTDTSTGNPTSFVWDFGDGDVSEEQNPSKTYENSGIFTVKLTASNSAGTGEEVKTNLINALGANPPVANFTADPLAGLAPLDVNFTDTSTGNPTSWAWDFGDGNVSDEQNPTNTYNMRGIFNVELIVSSSNGANGVLKTNLISVQVPNAPVAEFKADTTAGFVPLGVNFTDVSTGDPTSFAWDFGDGDFSDEQNPGKTYENAGFYTVALTVSSANGTDVAVKLNLINAMSESAPRAAFAVNNSTGFVPLDVQFTDQSTGNVTSYAWDFGDGGSSGEQNPAYTYESAGIFTVDEAVSGPNGTTSMRKQNLIIAMAQDAPTTDFGASVTSGFAPLEVDFSDKSTGKPGSWAWEFGDGSTSQNQNPTYTYNVPGIYSVKLLSSSSNGSDLEIKTNLISVESKDGPVAGFTANPTAGFAPLEVQFSDVSAGDPVSWAWEFGDGNTSSDQNPVNTYNKGGFFTVSLTVSNADGTSVETKTNLIDVFESSGPVAEFSADVTSGFAPLAVQFSDLSAGGPESWAWEFGDGNTSSEQNPKNTYNVAGLFNVSLTVSNASGASSEVKTNLINAIGEGGPVANFIADPTAGLKPLSVKFTDISSGDPTTWAWDFGNGNTSSEQDTSNVYNVEGLYTVELTVSNSKGASTEIKTNLINVNSGSGPSAEFAASTTSGLAPLAVDFSDLSTGGPTTWAWDFGNGDVSSVQNPSVSYNVAGLYSPSLTVSNSEGANTEVKNNLINAAAVGGPVAEFSASPTSGLKPLAVVFTDLSAGVPTNWAWDFGDGGISSDQNPSHTYNKEGFFRVELTASNSAGASTEIKTNLISVLGSGAPVAAFSATPTAGLAPLVVQFTDLSEGGVTSWTWTFGDGGTSSDQSPSHTYKRDGFFNAKLVVSGSEGSDNAQQTIIVEAIPQPIADFEATPNTGAAPLNVRFTDFSQPEGHIDSYLWDFGDGATSRDSNPSHNYRRDGFFSPKLTISGASGAASETKINLINILPVPVPVADFAASPTAGQSPLTVQFTDLSQPEGGIDSWLWDFGDGGTSLEQNPSHSYRGTEGGFFTVSLTISNASGANSETKTNLIQITGVGAPVANFSATPTVGQVPLTVKFEDNSEPAGNIASWLWDFGDAGRSIDQNPSHVYKSQGFFTVSLTISNSGGADSEVRTNLIQVEGLGTPVARFVASPTVGQVPLDVKFEDRSEPAGLIDSFLWDFGDGATSTEQNPEHTYTTEGFFTVSLTVSNEGGANIENKTNLIFIKGEGVPVAEFSATPTAGKPPLDVEFTDKSQGNVANWLWSFGDGSTSTEQNPMHTYTSPGIFTVVLGVSGSGGADSEKKINLIGLVEEGKVEAAFTASPNIGIVPLTVEFTDNTAGDIDGWLWDFGDGSTSDEQDPVHDYTEPGDYTVTLTVTGPSNSDEEKKVNIVRVISDAEGSFAALFDYEPVIGFSPVEVQFYDQTQGVNVGPDSWDWDFGDGGSSSEETPLHEYTVTGQQEFDVSLTVGVGGDEGSFLIEDAVKVVEDTVDGVCTAIMSIKPDPINPNSNFRAVKANIALSSGCGEDATSDIRCDSIEMAGAKPDKCTLRRGSFVANFKASDLDIESGTVELVLTGETNSGQTFTASDTVDVQ